MMWTSEVENETLVTPIGYDTCIGSKRHVADGSTGLPSISLHD